MVHVLDEPSEELGVLAPVLANQEPLRVDPLIDVHEQIPQETRAVVLDGVEPQSTELHLPPEPLHPVKQVVAHLWVLVVDIGEHSVHRVSHLPQVKKQATNK